MSSPHDKKKTLPFRVKFAFAIGSFGGMPAFAAMSFFLMVFYTDVALISPAIASMALTVGKIWDIINDPLIGWMADRTKSKHGRRRVYLIYGAVPLVIGTAILWMVSVGLSATAAFVWIAITYIIFSTVNSLVRIPYSALTAEVTQDYDERTNLLTFSSIGSVVGYMVGSILVRMIVSSADTPKLGYMIAGGMFGLLAGLTIAFVAWRVKEPKEFESISSKMSIVASLKATFQNKPFVMLISAFGLVRFALTLMKATMMYFVVYNLIERRDAIGSLLTVLLLVVGVFIIFWKWVGKRWTKNISYAGGLMIVATSLIFTFWLGKGDMNIMMIIAAVLAVGMSSHWVMPWAMLPDVIEYDELRTGERREGMFFGVYGLVDKIAGTLAIVILGWVLEIYNYVPNVEQTPEALLSIRLLFGPIPAAIIFLAIPILLKYPVNRESHANVVAKLKDRQKIKKNKHGFNKTSQLAA